MSLRDHVTMLKFKTLMFFDPANQLLVYPTEIVNYVRKGVDVRTVIAAQFQTGNI